MNDPNSSDVLDAAQVAEMLGVDLQTVHTYVHRSRTSAHPFPAPHIRLSNRPGWTRAQVQAWVDTRPGRGKGPRVRPGDPLGKLAKLPARKGVTVLPFVSAYDLGWILAERTAVEIEALHRAGRIPVAAKVVESGDSNRWYTAFDYAELHAWLTACSNAPDLGPRER